MSHPVLGDAHFGVNVPTLAGRSGSGPVISGQYCRSCLEPLRYPKSADGIVRISRNHYSAVRASESTVA
jgi:hypothetical protein